MSLGIKSLAAKLIKDGAEPTDIYIALLEAGAEPCVAREWANEPHRRAHAAAQRERRKLRTTALRGPRGSSYRSIIKTETKGGRERHFHATKGWRSYRGS